MKASRAILGALGLAALGAAWPSSDAHATPLDMALLRVAYRAIESLDLKGASGIIEKLPLDQPEALRLRARLELYQGHYDQALADARRAGEPSSDEDALVLQVAAASARATAGALVVESPEHQVTVRTQDDADAPLVPLLAEVAEQAVKTLSVDLGVTLDRPIRIELVRDQFSLAGMTGLPEKAAQTTGNVAIAKWGRITMLSPRATPDGYPWADTLAHELTHLVETKASHDMAPLWLQEGVAKLEETRWRPGLPFDEKPSFDEIASKGFASGLALPLDRMGPSLALLPSAEQASVAYAEVASFVRYWSKQNGDGSVARLLAALAQDTSNDPVDGALQSTSGAGLSAWSTRWNQWLLASVAPPPSLVSDSSGGRSLRQLGRSMHLADLLMERGHWESTLFYSTPLLSELPRDPSVRARQAWSLLHLGRESQGMEALGTRETLQSGSGRWFLLEGLSKLSPSSTGGPSPASSEAPAPSPPEPASPASSAGSVAPAAGAWGLQGPSEEPFERALWVSPLDLNVACERVEGVSGWLGAHFPESEPARTLCAALRQSSQH